MRKLLFGFFLVCLAPGLARAGGFIMPTAGVRAASMGGAWVAQGDDLSVLDHNPSQMVRLTESRAEVHYNAYYFNSSFEPTTVNGLGGGARSENQADFVNHIPNVYGMVPIGERWRIGFGVFSPVGPRHTYSSQGAQRYQIQQAVQSLAWPTVSAAFKVTDKFAASLSADIAYVSVEQRFALGLVPGFRSLDGSLAVKGSGFQMPRPKLGLLYALPENFTAGFAALPGMTFKLSGRIEADVPQVGFTPDTAYDDMTATQRAPTEFRLGVGWRPEKWRAEATVRYYRWSEYKEQLIDLKRNRIGDFEIADIKNKKYYQDSLAFQIGAGYQINTRHQVRAGYTYDQQAAQNEGLTIQDFDAPKHVIGLGYGTTFKKNKYSLDFGYNHIFYAAQNVTNSETAPISVLGPAPALGNGTYRWSVDMFQVAVGVNL